MAEEDKKDNPQSVTNIYINGDVKDSNIVSGSDNEINSKSSVDTNKRKSDEIYVNAGGRLRQVREEINLKSSEFIAELSFPSERNYLEMEKNIKEVPLSLLTKVANLTGVSINWLMHGDGQRFEIETSDFRPIDDGLDFIAKLNPQRVYFVLGYSNFALENLVTGIVLQTDKHRYQVIDYGMHLDFWNWIDQLGYIPLFYEFLNALWDRYYGPNGIVIPIPYSKRLFKGEIHFREAVKHSKGKYLFWPNAVLDINYEHQSKAYYERYYGKWISRVHSGFIEISEAMKKRDL